MPQIILVEKSTVIPATSARLYKSLTDAKQLSRWLADRVESDPHQGGQTLHAEFAVPRRGDDLGSVQIVWDVHGTYGDHNSTGADLLPFSHVGSRH